MDLVIGKIKPNDFKCLRVSNSLEIITITHHHTTGKDSKAY